MVVGIDVSPLHTGHKVRGIGFYVQRLIKALKKLENSKIPAASSASKAGKQIKIKELKSKEEIKRQDYDLLHIPYFNPYFLTMPWPWQISKPIVVTIHDLIPVKYPNLYPPGIKAKVYWQIQKLLLKQAKLVITDSFASKYDIADLTGFPSDQIFVTYLAAGEEFKKLTTNSEQLIAIREKYDLPDTFALYVGDVNRNKNIPGLVKACKKINLPLVIVGKQAVSKNYDKSHVENNDLVWLQNYFENCNLKIENSKFLNLVGFVAMEDLVALYNLARVYCQPSFDEGFGLPVLEAMACGCPVVSSNRGSLPEVVGEAGLLTEPTVAGLAKALRKIHYNDSNDYNNLIEKGLKRAAEFSWEETAQKTAEIYQTALEAHSLQVE
jgi:glycosyltransferase involved in cell wall biosynthesis